jgi:two-component system cell cycle response regulator CtrA
MTAVDQRYVQKIETENDELRAQNEDLQFRIRELQTAVGMSYSLPMCLPLTSREAALLGVLMQRDVATKDMILMALYNGMDEPQVKIIDVFVCKMRKKLQPFEIEISTLWGRGYYLAKEMKEKVRQLREQELTTPTAAAA